MHQSPIASQFLLIAKLGQGVLILLLKAKLLPVPPEEIRRLRKSVIYFALLNFVIGGTSMFLRTKLIWPSQ